MRKTVRVQCPFCKGTMDVDVETGKITDKWEKTVVEPGKDQMEEALKKIYRGKDEREAKFRQAKEELDHKKEKMEELFKEQLKKTKEDKDAGKPPLRPFDLD